MTFEDSATYHENWKRGFIQGFALGFAMGFDQGVTQEARRLLLLMSRKRFGSAPATAEATLQAIDDAARLERMAERIFEATGWDDLLATP